MTEQGEPEQNTQEQRREMRGEEKCRAGKGNAGQARARQGRDARHREDHSKTPTTQNTNNNEFVIPESKSNSRKYNVIDPKLAAQLHHNSTMYTIGANISNTYIENHINILSSKL